MRENTCSPSKIISTAKWTYIMVMLAETALWLVLGIITISKSDELFPQALIGMLMLGDAIAFGVFAFLHKNKRIITNILILLFLSANVILTFTDQMGVMDYAVLVLNIVAIAAYVVLSAKKTAKPI